MTWPLKRRACGLALTLFVSWDAALLRAENEPALPEAPNNGAPVLLDLGAPNERLTQADPTLEKVQERFPSRALKIERHVAQDEAGNYFDHGSFTRWAEDGRMMGRGQFRYGQLDGTWVRWFSVDETQEKFADVLARGFEGPFTSQAEFVDGRLHGTWTIVDAQKRQVAAWEFEHGRRHGLSAWWYPDGSKFREVEYRAGELDGAACEWSKDGRLVTDHKYVNGFRHGVKIEYYDSGEVKSEAETLFARDVLASTDDWWNGTTNVTVVGQVGNDQRHGKYTAWNRQGQKILEGNYVDDSPEGRFTWYYDSGTKAIEGSYAAGKQHGQWTWWYANGLREISGEYAQGLECGQWRRWDDDGRVSETARIMPAEARLLFDHSAALEPLAAPVPEPVDVPTLEGPQPPSVLQKVAFETPAAPEPESVLEIDRSTDAAGPETKPVVVAVPTVRAVPVPDVKAIPEPKAVAPEPTPVKEPAKLKLVAAPETAVKLEAKSVAAAVLELPTEAPTAPQTPTLRSPIVRPVER
jgi:antitoxin component YwqK of YwqJK toxin-antitoxin module